VPGMTNSGFQNNWLRSDGKADLRFDQGMTPEYLAAKIVDAIRRNRTETVVGREAKRLLRFNRYFPRLTNWLIAKPWTWNYRAIYEALEHVKEKPGRLRRLWWTITFPHVHHWTEE